MCCFDRCGQHTNKDVPHGDEVAGDWQDNHGESESEELDDNMSVLHISITPVKLYYVLNSSFV